MSMKKPALLPLYLPDTRAIALGGEIKGVRSAFPPVAGRADGHHDHEPLSLAVEGASCVLGPGIHRAAVTRTDAITRYEHTVLTRASRLEASARLSIDKESRLARSTARSHIKNLVIGVPGESLTIEEATTEIYYHRELKPGGHSNFAIQKASLEIEGMTVHYNSLDEALTRYGGLKERLEAREKQGPEKAGACPRPMNYGCLESAAKANPALVLTLVDHIDIKQDGRITPIPGTKHGVYVQEVGQIYFGELIVHEHSRYFSLFRMELGCHVVGHVGSGGGGNGEPVFEDKGAIWQL